MYTKEIATRYLSRRKNMAGKRFISRLGILVTLSGMSVATVLVTLSPITQARGTHSTLQHYADQMHSAGATSVLIDARHGRHDSVKVRAGTAELGTNRPVPWDAHFRTGSTTKTFVATVVLQLVSEGKLSLNDTVEQWLPGLLGANYDASHITLRQLLNHTSGIFDYTSDDTFFSTLETPEAFYANRFRTYTPSQLVNIAKAHPPVFAPGSGWDYSNTNYIIVGMIIKKATGHDWSVEVKNRISRPLGLTETTMAGSSPFMPTPFAHAYHIYTENSSARQYTDTTLHNMSWASSAGDIITTTRDENRFFQALMKGKLLGPAQLAEMKTTVPIDETFSYGLGLMHFSSPCDERGIWGHDGGTVGYSTSNGVTEDGQRSVVISLATTTFTDLEFAEATFQLRTDAVNAGICGKSTDWQRVPHTNRQSQGLTPSQRLL